MNRNEPTKQEDGQRSMDLAAARGDVSAHNFSGVPHYKVIQLSREFPQSASFLQLCYLHPLIGEDIDKLRKVVTACNRAGLNPHDVLINMQKVTERKITDPVAELQKISSTVANASASRRFINSVNRRLRFQ